VLSTEGVGLLADMVKEKGPKWVFQVRRKEEDIVRALGKQRGTYMETSPCHGRRKERISWDGRLRKKARKSFTDD